jgi:hypothetical protein
VARDRRTVVALEDRGREAPFEVDLDLIDVPGFGSERIRLFIDRTGIPSEHVSRVRRTYEAPRCIELAAIALAALGLYHAVMRSWTWPYAAAAPTIW